MVQFFFGKSSINCYVILIFFLILYVVLFIYLLFCILILYIVLRDNYDIYPPYATEVMVMAMVTMR